MISTPIDEGRMHVYPLHDLRDHVIDPVVECWCHLILDENGIVVHNSLDRREQYETGELQPH